MFFIYPQKSWEERKSDIDEEMKQRVKAAGGMYEDVDVRASLLWNNKNDLDLRVIAPSGEEIFYAHKNSRCGGWLDIDMNAGAPYTTKPVENTRWKKGMAPNGHYRVYVQNYAFHESNDKATEFRVEIQIGDEIMHFDGKTPEGLSGQRSDTAVYEFDYDPGEQKARIKEDKYAGYNDTFIKNQWASVIPPENILICEDPRGIIDIMLGALTLMEETNNIDNYLVDMRERGQTELRLKQTEKALFGLAESVSRKSDKVVVSEADLPAPEKNRKSKSSRL